VRDDIRTTQQKFPNITIKPSKTLSKKQNAFHQLSVSAGKTNSERQIVQLAACTTAAPHQLLLKEKRCKHATSKTDFTESQKNKTTRLVRQHSKPFLKKKAQIVPIQAISTAANSECSKKNCSPKKTQNTHISREKNIKPCISRKSPSECQDVISNTDARPADIKDSSKTLVFSVNTELDGRTGIASNKNVLPITDNTVVTPINEVAANDTNYEVTPVTNIITQHRTECHFKMKIVI